MEKFKAIVSFNIKDYGYIRRIQERFGMEKKLTVNYECPVELDDEADVELLREVERLGYIRIMEGRMFEFPKQ